MSTVEEIGNLGDATLKGMKEHYGRFVIVIENLKDFSSAEIVVFIREELHMSPKAYVYQSLFLQSYTCTVVVGNDKEEIRKLRDFLGDPNEIIVYSRGRYIIVPPLLEGFSMLV